MDMAGSGFSWMNYLATACTNFHKYKKKVLCLLSEQATRCIVETQKGYLFQAWNDMDMKALIGCIFIQIAVIIKWRLV